MFLKFDEFIDLLSPKAYLISNIKYSLKQIVFAFASWLLKSLNHDWMPLKRLVLFAHKLLFLIPVIPWTEINQPLKLKVQKVYSIF